MFDEIFESCLGEKREFVSLVGKRIIQRSNEDVPLLIGKVIRYEDFGGKAFEPVPMVISEKDGKEYLCMGMVVEYSEDLLRKLEGLSPKEQWDYLKKDANV